MQAYILRKKFLDFFKSKKHKIVESDFLVPKDDPTILFTPAGMNQFKKEFLGLSSGLKRAATSQRCLRTDDLDKVGVTTGHHTFFEMLGNFSFGDYFKKEAISYAWEFLTQELNIPEEKLWVSVYKDDDEAYKTWLDLIKVPENKIIKLGDKENFWPSEAKEKGPNGPCGPCSEIFFDLGENTGCQKSDCNPACNCGRFIEVWNLVFTQFNRKAGGVLEPLPKKNIDTGMGLERLAAVMQGVTSNFETDLFAPIVKEIAAGCRLQAAGEKQLIYAVSDHIRAIAFAIYDGVLPSNEARGYVVRKLIRKGTLHLKALGFTRPFLYKLVPLVSDIMKSYYPEIEVRKENIAEIILSEEKSFIGTLDSSDRLLSEVCKEIEDDYKKSVNVQSDKNKLLSLSAFAGQKTFQLYDTYGIPLDLTKDWFHKKSIFLDENEVERAFNKKLSEQKNRSKLQSTMRGDVFSDKDLVYHIKATKFLGYKDYSIKAKIIKIVKENIETKKISKDDEAVIVLDKTPFYAEGGGQVGDTGEFTKGKNTYEVTDTKKVGSVFVHIGKVKSGSFKKNDTVLAKVNIERRLSIARNHTATHLLQGALRKVLGPHVKQQGSLVGEDRLRFDFTHFKDIKKEELDRIEEVVNSDIMNNHLLNAKQMPLSEAKKSGALAFFGEKYGDRVRVVSVGDLSRELCGGTHLDATGQIGLFKITQESSIASGIRRIEAVTGAGAYKIIKEEERIINDISNSLNIPAEKLVQEIEKRTARIKELEKKLKLQELDSIKASLDSLVRNAEVVKDIKIITQVMENLDIDLLRKNIDLIKAKTSNTIIALGSKVNGRALLVMGVTEDLCRQGIDAAKLIKDVAKFIGGSGGGRSDFAQAGGNNPENFEKAFHELKNIISKS